MIKLKKSESRGHVAWEWLNSYHSFSFGEYYNPDMIHFGPLRVLNDDTVAAGNGFGMHPHKDMEIITYVTAGEIEHQDSMGNREIIRKNEVQKMSAGKGIMHSEMNPSQEHEVKLFQTWIIPNQKGLVPYYEMKKFSEEDKLNTLYKIAAADGADDAVYISQDAYLYVSVLEAGKHIEYKVLPGRGIYLHVVYGTVNIGGPTATAGDAILVEDETGITITSSEKAEFLLFDVKMDFAG